VNNFSNLPINNNNLESTIQAFDAYYSTPIEINATAYAAMTGYFNSKGFDITAAEAISTIIMRQARQDSYDPMKILDSLRGLSDVELSGIVAEILNYNRLSTSSLGISKPFRTNLEIARNIIP
jgi:hypothetical protein